MNAPLEVATKLSAERLELHLRVFEGEVTPAMLHNKLGIRETDLFNALLWPANADLLGDIYDAKRDEWGGEIVEEMHGGVEPNIRPMGPRAEVADEDKFSLLILGEATNNVPFSTWVLPKKDFVVPFSGTLLSALGSLVDGGPASFATVKLEPFVYPGAEIDALVKAVEAVRVSVEKRAKTWRKYAKHLVAYRHAEGVVHLTARAMNLGVAYDNKRGDAGMDARQRKTDAAFVNNLRLELAEIRDEVELELLENAKDPVEDALSLLGSAGIRDAVQYLALDPQAIDAAEADELLTALQFTAEVMSSSTGAHEFLRDHIVPAVTEVCHHPPYGFKPYIATLKRVEFKTELETGWVETAAEVQKQFGPPRGDSVFAPLATAAKHYRRAGGLLALALKPEVLSQMWRSLPGNARPRGNRFASWLFRIVVSTGVPDSRSKGFVNKKALLMLDGLDYKKVLSAVDDFPKHTDGRYWTRRGLYFEDLGLHKQFGRSRGSAGLGFISSMAILFATSVDSAEDSTVRGLLIGQGLLGGIAETTKILEMTALRSTMRAKFKTFHQVDTLGKVHPWIARTAVLFGTLAAGTSLAHGSKDPFRDLLGVSADTLTMGAWASEALGGYVAAEESTALLGRLGLKAGEKIAAEFALRTLALQLSLFASIVGVCALAWSLRPERSGKGYGAEAVALRYLNAALEWGGPFDGKRESILRVFNKAAVSLQRRLSDLIMHLEKPRGMLHQEFLKWEAGEPGAWAPDQPPTWWVCSAMGLTREEIGYLFMQPEEALAQAGVPKSRRGKRKFVE